MIALTIELIVIGLVVAVPVTAARAVYLGLKDAKPGSYMPHERFFQSIAALTIIGALVYACAIS